MPGTKAGGRKAARTNKELYGDKFYQEIGRKGGRNGHTGGFASNLELARTAGAKGGRISKRGAKGFTEQVIEPNADKIQELYDGGMTIEKISKTLKVPLTTLRKWANLNLEGYGREWEEM